jgi:hypothetical protein
LLAIILQEVTMTVLLRVADGTAPATPPPTQLAVVGPTTLSWGKRWRRS